MSERVMGTFEEWKDAFVLSLPRPHRPDDITIDKMKIAYQAGAAAMREKMDCEHPRACEQHNHPEKHTCGPECCSACVERDAAVAAALEQAEILMKCQCSPTCKKEHPWHGWDQIAAIPRNRHALDLAVARAVEEVLVKALSYLTSGYYCRHDSREIVEVMHDAAHKRREQLETEKNCR